MAEKKFVDGTGVKAIKEDYEAKIGKKVDAVEGKSLVDDTEITKLQSVKANAEPNTITGIQINGTDLTPDGESKKVNITAADLAPDLKDYVQDSELTEQLTPYLKSTDAESTYVKEEGFDEKVKATVGSVYRPKGSMENFEAIKAVETPTEGDVYNATDTGANYVYVGEGQGDDESGWDKLSETVDLSGYMTTVTADGKYAKKTALESLQSTVEGLDSTYATDTELSTAISGLSETYAAKADLPEAMSEEEIKAILQPAD